MKHRLVKGIRGIMALAVILAVLSMLPFAVGENYSAETMRLLRYDGSVEILDVMGSPRFVMENVRFASGEVMRTGEGSTASVSLDDTKIVSLDQNSTVKFEKTGSHIELTLTEGTLFLDVSEKLDENESLDITTSTMTVGIRGTMIVATVMPAGQAANLYGLNTEAASNANEEVTVFGVLEGSVALTSNSGKTATVNAGQIAVVGGDQQESPDVTDMTSENVTPFIKQQFEDANTVTRILDSCPQLFTEYDFPANGYWEYTGRIMIIAQSASKLYDGNPLTRTGDILVYGLPDIFDISAFATGSITNAGTAENPIGTYAIYNGIGENVTDHFSIIETVPGQLVVDPAPMTIWTGSATKSYDGTPLTCEEAGFDLVSGNTREEPWRNTSLVLSEAEGETLYGLSGELLVHGTNPLTGETSRIVLGAGEKLTVQLSDESNADSITFSVEKMTEDEIPEEVLRLYADNPDLLTQACSDAGWDEDRILERIGQLPQYTGPTTVKDGLTVSVSYAGGLMRQLTNARINIDSEITDYNGRALNGEEAHFAEIRIDDSVKVTATGSQTEVGESDNTYEIDWGNEDLNNFIITEDLGTLRVLSPMSGVTVSAPSATKVYDGWPLTAGEATVTGLPEGYTLTATVEGELTDAGTAESRITEYRLYDAEGEDVTEYYPDLATETGTLTVQRATLKVTTGSASKVYDGQQLTSSEAKLTGFVNGERAKVSAKGKITDAGTAKNGYAIDWTSANAANYRVTESLGKLTVEALSLSIDMGDAVSTYTGSTNMPTPTLTYLNGEHAGETVTATRLRAADIVYGFELFTGDSIRITLTGGGSDAGSYEVTADVNVSGSASNFSLSGSAVEGFVLTVEPATLSITTGSASKVYDATELTSKEVSVAGLQGGDSITVTAAGSITDAGETENTYEIDWGEADPENYVIDEELGRLTVEPLGISYDFGGRTIVFPGKDEIVLHSGGGKITITNGPRAGEQVEYTWVGTTNSGHGFRFELMGTTFYLSETFWRKYSEVGTYDLGDTPIFYDGGADNFTFTAVDDKLVIVPLQLSVTVDGGTAAYTGEACLPGVTVKYENGDYAGTALTDIGYEETDEGLVLYCGLNTGDELCVNVSPAAVDAGTYQVSAGSYYFSTGQAGNYTVTTGGAGTLTVNPAELTVTTGSASKAYDGTPLTSSEASLEGLVNGEKATAVATGTITEIGTTRNTYTIEWDTAKEQNYTVTEETLGTLEVREPIKLSVDLGGQTQVYNGSDGVSRKPAITYLNGEHAGETVSPASFEYTLDGSQASFTLYNGETVDLTVTGWAYKNAGTYTLTGSCDFSGNASDYNVSYTYDTITITPAPLKVTTKSASKVYDGKDLQGELASVEGLIDGDDEFITVTATGAIKNAGTADNTYKIDWGGTPEGNYAVSEELGTLTVERLQLNFTIGNVSMDYRGGLPSSYTPHPGATLVIGNGPHAGEGVEGSRQFNTSGGNVQEAVYFFSYPEGDGFALSVKGFSADAGVHTLTGKFTMSSSYMDTSLSNFSASITNGSLTVKPVKLTVTTGSAEKTCDGEALMYEEANLTGLVDADKDKVTVTATGTITDPGSTVNTYKIDWGGVSSGNYTISEDLGTLTVYPNFLAYVTVTASSAVKAYDGTELTSPGYDVSGLPDYFTCQVTVTGSRTDVGETANTVSCKIYYGGEDVTPDMMHLTTEDGTLKVEPLRISVVPDNWKVEYDGKMKWTGADVSYVNGESAGTTITFSDVGTSGSDHLFYYQLNTGDTLTVSIPQAGPGTGEYGITPGCSVSGSSGNYIVVTASGIVTITPAKVTVTTGSASKAYDGKELTKADGTGITGLKGSDTATVTATGSIVDVGSAANTYTIDWGSTNSANYTVTEDLGTLTVTANGTPVTITLLPETAVYDGKPHYGYEFDYTGLPDSLWVTIETDASLTDVGTVDNHIIGYTIWDSEENVVTSYFSSITTVDSTLTVEQLGIQVTVEGGEREWSGDIQFPSVTATYVNGDHSGIQLSNTGDSVSGYYRTLTFKSTDVDTVTVTVTVQGTSSSEPNQYEIPAPTVSVSTSNCYVTASGGCTITITLDPYSTDEP